MAYEDGGGASKTPCYYKVLRDPDTEYNVDPTKVNVCQSDPDGHWITVPFKDAKSGLIDVVQLKNLLQKARNRTIAPNLFAFEMFESYLRSH